MLTLSLLICRPRQSSFTPIASTIRIMGSLRTSARYAFACSFAICSTLAASALSASTRNTSRSSNTPSCHQQPIISMFSSFPPALVGLHHQSLLALGADIRMPSPNLNRLPSPCRQPGKGRLNSRRVTYKDRAPRCSIGRPCSCEETSSHRFEHRMACRIDRR